MKGIEKRIEKSENKIFIFANSSDISHEKAFREVCDDLNIKSVFLKGKIEDGVTSLQRDDTLIAAVIFQKKNPGDNLNLISEIKINFRHLPIIFFSTRYSEDVETLIRRTGVHYFLTPDFTKEELALVLEALADKMKNDSFERVV